MDNSQEKEAKRRLWDIKPDRVDVVDAPANLVPFLICKSKEGPMGTNGANVEPLDGGTDNLESMILALGNEIKDLRATVEKDANVEIEKKSPAAVMREVGERAMSAAKKLEEAGAEADPEMAAKEVAALIKLLEGLGGKYPEVAKAAGCQEDEQGNEIAGKIGGIATSLYDIANRVEQGMSCNEAVEDLVAAVQGAVALVSGIGIQKSETLPELPTEVTGNDEAAQRVAFAKMLREIVIKAGSVHATFTNPPSDAHKADLQFVIDNTEALIAAVPTRAEKTAATIANTINGFCERAESLAKQAEELKFDDEAALKNLANAQEVLKGLGAKYADVKKAEFAPDDFARALDTSALLDAFEAGLRRLGIMKAEKEQIEKAEAEKAKAVEPPAQNTNEQSNAELLARIDTLAEQVKGMQAVIAKAKTVPEQAAKDIADKAGKVGNEKAFPPCPGDYNDPAYREQVKEWGL